MSLAPGILRIKRKRTDEPIDSLYVEAHGENETAKRPMHFGEYVFRRQAQESDYERLPLEVPKIIATQPGDESNFTSTRCKDHRAGQRVPKQGEESKTSPVAGKSRRQFHLSRSSITSVVGKRKQGIEPEDEVAILVESPTRKQKLDYNEQTNQPPVPQVNAADDVARPLKRPGVGSRVGRNSGRVASKPPDGVVDSRLHEAMLRFAVESEAANAETEASLKALGQDGSDEDVSMHDAEEGDYVYDTFVRFSTEPSALTPNGTLADLDRVGYLIIEDKDQELWEMYVDADQESEKDWDSEQDDENAENYYGADYPEDEVDLEDEFDEHPYVYRKGAASDDEEFDLDDAWSDDEFDGYGGKIGQSHQRSDTLRTPLNIDNDDDEGLIQTSTSQ